MIELKNPKDLPYAGYQVCEVKDCKEQSEKIWASSEIRIIDLCLKHYDQLRNERYTP